MWTLIRRELNGMVTINVRNSIQTYIIFALLFILFMWLLGPNVTGLLELNTLSLFVFLVGVLLALFTMSFHIEEDIANRQMAFLQTLPIQKSAIVHAKFLSILLLCGFIFIWMSTIFSMNLLINDVWTIESWMVVFPVLAFLVFLMAETLLWYFLRGNLRGNWIFYFLLIIFVNVFNFSGFHKLWGISEGLFYGIWLITSLLAYLICWWIAVKRVKLKGFPKEVDSPGRKKTEKHMEDLKRRQAERHS